MTSQTESRWRHSRRCSARLLQTSILNSLESESTEEEKQNVVEHILSLIPIGGKSVPCVWFGPTYFFFFKAARREIKKKGTEGECLAKLRGGNWHPTDVRLVEHTQCCFLLFLVLKWIYFIIREKRECSKGMRHLLLDLFSTAVIKKNKKIARTRARKHAQTRTRTYAYSRTHRTRARAHTHTHTRA